MRVEKGRSETISGRARYISTIVFQPQDIKMCLQSYLKDLKEFDLPNAFREKDILKLFQDNLFHIFNDEDESKRAAKWATKIAIKKEYFTVNSWDREKPTMYFINEDILTLKPGPKGANNKKQVYKDENDD
jgi:hypothetical protein